MAFYSLVHRRDAIDLRVDVDVKSPIRVQNREMSLTPPLPQAGRASAAPGRRLIVGCDGTWLNSDSSKTIPSNIVRLCRSLNVPGSKKEQIIYYSRGVGSDGNIYDKYVGGMTGTSDLSEHVRECFDFLVSNYRENDEIFLFGFSRGAYTARAISSLISDVGLLTETGMEYFVDIFEDWKTQNLQKPGQRNGPVTNGAFKGLPSEPVMPSNEYRAALLQRGYTIPNVPIRAIGVFDTVGALGIPPIFGLDFSHDELIAYSFVNNKVAQNIIHAFQALALDEHRASFSPTLWQMPDEPDRLQTLRQVWFPGVHSNIGGSSYDDEGISNITLAWMVSRLQETEADGPMLEFNEDYIKWCFSRNVDNCNEVYQPGGKGAAEVEEGYVKVLDGYRGWAMGRIEETLTSLYKYTGQRKDFSKSKSLKDWLNIGDVARTPGRYKEVNADIGDVTPTGHLLEDTGERIHPSVRYRVENGGRGISDVVGYTPKGLEAFKIGCDHHASNPSARLDPLAPGYFWQGKGDEGQKVVLPEERMGRFEKLLLQESIEALAASRLSDRKGSL